MIYKTSKGSKIYTQLQELFAQRKSIRTMGIEIMKEVGANHYRESGDFLAGNITGFQFDYEKEKPKTFKGSYKDCFPKNVKENEKLLAKISAVPTLHFKELNKILKYKPQTVERGRGIMLCDYPAVRSGEDCYYIEIEKGCKYKPIEGVEVVSQEEAQSVAF